AGLSTISYALRYPGQVDDFNGLFYNFNRFYDPRVGRFTQADPIGLEGGWNRFGYVGGNPLMFIDPDGLFPFYPGTLRCIPGWPCTPRGPIPAPPAPVCCDQEKLKECLLGVDPLAAADLAKCAATRDKQSCILALLEAGKASACFAAHCSKNK